MIEIRNLKKTFGETTAVDVPSLDIRDGDILGLVGNNGAGKTTLFRLILDLLKADEGTVSINGLNPAECEDWKDFTGAYLDEGFLIGFLTPEEYFDFIGQVSNLSKDELSERLEHFTKFMEGEIMGKKKLIRDFSAGNKQKIGIISAMLSQPQLLILDEPFNFLDPSSQIHLKKLLTDYNAATNATILVSSHNLQHTIDISTRITLMEQGKILKDLDNENGSAAQELEDYFNAQD